MIVMTDDSTLANHKI